MGKIFLVINFEILQFYTLFTKSKDGKVSFVFIQISAFFERKRKKNGNENLHNEPNSVNCFKNLIVSCNF